MKSDLSGKLNKLKVLKARNRIRFKWQDSVLAIVLELHLPRFVQTEKNKEPLDVRAILMRHGKENLGLLQRRMALVKERGLAADEAFLYYLGIVEHEKETSA